MITNLKIIQFWLCVLAATVLSTMPPRGPVESSPDKLIHLIGYCLLFISCEIAYPGKDLLWKFRLVFGLSILLEFVQYFVPDRHLSILDMVANLVGVSLAVLFLKSLTALKAR